MADTEDERASSRGADDPVQHAPDPIRGAHHKMASRVRDERRIGHSQIGQLRRKFIRISTLAIAIILVTILLIINGAMSLFIGITLDRSLARIAGENPDAYVTDGSADNSLAAQFIPSLRTGTVDYYVFTVDADGNLVRSSAHAMSDLSASAEQELMSRLLAHNPDLQSDRTVKFEYDGEYFAVRVVDKNAQEEAKAEASSSSSPDRATPTTSAPSSSSSSPASAASGSSTASSATPSPSSSSAKSPSAYNAASDGSGTGSEPGTADIIFLNYTEIRSWQRQLRNLSTAVALLALLVFWLIVVSLSRRAIEPTVRTMENQKRFITNASHELKTPVAIISADAEVLEMMNGENEWTQSIINQSKRLNDLISALVRLTKAGESQRFELTDVDISQVASDAAASFRPVIEQHGLTLDTRIDEGIAAKAEPQSITEIVNILLDNSAKYCDEGGTVTISAASRGGLRSGATLTVSNDYKAGEGQDYSRFFERFYRADESHNSKKEGFGIGLAMAKELVTRMNGTLTVDWRDGRIAFTVTLR